MKNAFWLLLLLSGLYACSPNNVKQDDSLGKYFSENKVEGCFALMDNATGKFTVYNLGRYRDSSYLPASTFKIVNSLIGLQTGKIVNIKKGQFVSPEAMRFAKEKVEEEGNPNVILTERGTTFGYQDLVVDFRGLPAMQHFGATVVLDPQWPTAQSVAAACKELAAAKLPIKTRFVARVGA